MIHIENHGPLIVASDFWESPTAQAGKMLVSCNAGAIRVLIPDRFLRDMNDLATADHVIVSRGPWPEERLADAVEILWEDGTDSPNAWLLSASSFVGGMPAKPPAGRPWVVSVWTRKQRGARRGAPHKAIERPCYWRRVPSLPCLEEWSEVK